MIVTNSVIKVDILRVFIRHWRSPFTTQNSLADVWWPTTIFYSDVEPLSKYSPVMLHLSPATRILNENPVYRKARFIGKIRFHFRCLLVGA